MSDPLVARIVQVFNDECVGIDFLIVHFNRLSGSNCLSKPFARFRDFVDFGAIRTTAYHQFNATLCQPIYKGSSSLRRTVFENVR